jgi:E3 ubiquitin-protein ligase synoviolin
LYLFDRGKTCKETDAGKTSRTKEERAEILRQREAAAAEAEAAGTDYTPSTEPLPSEDDVDEMDIEVPGWESKGQWVLTLDLISGLSKLPISMLYRLLFQISSNLGYMSRSLSFSSCFTDSRFTLYEIYF